MFIISVLLRVSALFISKTMFNRAVLFDVMHDF